ncbi:MAG: LysR family transcriptional regulator [Jatrophihabitans sp.]
MTSARPDLEALRLLVLVADLGSISAAARAERISQPSASARMKTLESGLGLELLDRRSRGASLTGNGRLVTDWARAVVAAADVLVTGAAALALDQSEHVTVGASQTVAEYLVPVWLGEFRRRFEHASVRLRVANSQGVISALRSREVDVGFIESPSVPSDLRSRRVSTDRLVLVVAAQHPLARHRRRLTVAQLARIDLVTREDGSGTLETLRRAIAPVAVRPAVQVDSNAAVKVLVASGSYAAVLSELVVANELRDGRLVEIPVAGADLSRVLRAVWRAGARLRGAPADFLGVAARGKPQS